MNTRSMAGVGGTEGAGAATWTEQRWFRETLPAAAFVVLWSSGYIAGKTAVEHAAPFTVLTLRFGGAAALFALLMLARRVPLPATRLLLHSAVVGLLSMALQFVGVYGAFALGASSGFAALVIGCMPLATSLTAAVALGERQPASHWFGLLLGLGGVLLVLQDKLGSGLGSPVAGLLLLLGLCGITFGTLYQKRHALDLDLSAGLMMQNLAATVVLAPVAVLHEHLRFDGSGAFYGSMAWMIVVNSVGTLALLFVLLRRGAATRVSTLFYLVTPVTAVMGWAVMHEPMSAIKLAGFALAATGVYVGTRR
ncbi:MAG TPA: DMT family transporter [Nevskia sp.]|nr:DMT family transporter [Nevskia sp.]